MSRAMQHSADYYLRICLPVASALFAVLLNMVPWPSPLLRQLLAPLPLMVICYWVANRPDLISMRWPFLIGILQDLLAGQMLGVMAFSYLVADFVLRGQRQFFMAPNFLFSWLAFAVVITAASALQYAISTFFLHQAVDETALAVRAAIGVLLFPLIARLLHGLQVAVLARA